MNKKMNVAVVFEFGAPLELQEWDIPTPGIGQILVKTEACGVCHTDVHAWRGDWPLKPKPQFIPGHEGIGTVIAVGTGVTIEHTDGKRSPERKSFYEEIAATLRGADKILIFGHGTGESSAMDQLVIDLKRNHPEVADRIVGSVKVDWHHLNDEQLLAEARQFFKSNDH